MLAVFRALCACACFARPGSLRNGDDDSNQSPDSEEDDDARDAHPLPGFDLVRFRFLKLGVGLRNLDGGAADVVVNAVEGCLLLVDQESNILKHLCKVGNILLQLLLNAPYKREDKYG